MTMAFGYSPADIRYCPGGSVWFFPLITVFAPGRAAADAVAADGGFDPLDGAAFVYLALDSAEAQDRLRMWGQPMGGYMKMLRGD